MKYGNGDKSEGYFHGFKWIKRKKHPCHQYFILSDGIKYFG
jgi:hypothetical protein